MSTIVVRDPANRRMLVLRDPAARPLVALRAHPTPTVLVHGFRGLPGPAGRGEPGPAGQSFRFDGAASSYSKLPSSLTADDRGQTWLVNDEGRVYVWSGSEWPAQGTGAPFTQGATLPAGGAAGDVLTKQSTDDGDAGWREPSIPYASTNW